MKEFAMALWAMTASHHQWPTPPQEPVAVVRTVEAAQPVLSEEDKAILRAAMERAARCTTGKIVYDPASGFFVPEQTPVCR